MTEQDDMATDDRGAADFYATRLVPLADCIGPQGPLQSRDTHPHDEDAKTARYLDSVEDVLRSCLMRLRELRKEYREGPRPRDSAVRDCPCACHRGDEPTHVGLCVCGEAT